MSITLNLAARTSISACLISQKILLYTQIAMKPKIVLIDGAFRGAYYSDIREAFEADWIFERSPEFLNVDSTSIDLAMVSDERAIPYVAHTVCELVRRNVPTLHVVDGILEWRNTWENPTHNLDGANSMPLFNPVLCHKIACIGRSQARILESWGNLGKCEVIGFPRFDKLSREKYHGNKDKEPLKILVMTARTPGFTEDQLRFVKQSLQDLKKWFKNNRNIKGVSVKPVWRLTGGLSEVVEEEEGELDLSGKELAEALEQADAVITTPSTAMLEGMLKGLPVALLDYNNCPHYVPAAWEISASAHMDKILTELIEPPAHKMLYQDTILHDALECVGSATPRMVQLIEKMIDIGRECRKNNKLVSFPATIVANEYMAYHFMEERFDLQKLYPDYDFFDRNDKCRMQAELGHLRRDMARLESYINNMQTSMEYRLAEKMTKCKNFFPFIR